jgi:hypothetical protein
LIALPVKDAIGLQHDRSRRLRTSARDAHAGEGGSKE